MEIKITDKEMLEISFEDLKNFSETRMIHIPRKIVMNFIENGEVIGFVNFDMRYFNKNAYITYYLIPEERGKGKGKLMLREAVNFAFNELNLERLTAEVYEYNIKSINLLKRFGFKLEGQIRKGKYHDGKYYDILIYGLLKEERAG
ncbi:GNAT family N-acetyltransferase [Thermosipho atlanticus]|uniref:Acetyltransferase (GNAT) family protein n=1 Tax=Thermosipho atlanticus DSM 15807 TaxID=1123380 RepID=A0A1M5RU72_9BACT|nr:GNAT family protein [Thermosipho atlanticus]SHH29857.1 Acetyltransferase (GNAT) family protein [Thermosipho atlanticus DSM 15807]